MGMVVYSASTNDICVLVCIGYRVTPRARHGSTFLSLVSFWVDTLVFYERNAKSWIKCFESVLISCDKD